MCATLQGWCSSSDCYTKRYDEIIKDQDNVVKQIDDTLLWASSYEEAYRRTVEYLKLVGNNGIILNKKKFVYAEEEVDYAGFRITKDMVKPLEKNLEAIRDFPTPTNISGIRSFFALANNLNYCTKVKEIIGEFRPMLSPKTKFEWDKTKDERFERVKRMLIEQARDGVRQFSMKSWTVLETDYSKEGLGYCLKQKRCNCPLREGKIDLTCCDNGYRTVMCGSRFTSSAEANYAAVEGELLALTWALESTEHFTMQNPRLVISTDHKPLVQLVKNTSTTDLNAKNKRLCRLKERVLRWNIRDVIYTPGKNNGTADALSRRPTAAAVSLAAMTATRRLTADEIAAATDASKAMRDLKKQIQRGFPDSKSKMKDGLDKYWRVRNRLRINKQGIVTMDDRMVVPDKLRGKACRIAHAAHQGVNSMHKALETRLYWPSMDKHLQETRDKCDWCTRRAPSQAKLPPAAIVRPTEPMEDICIDFAQAHGRRFGIMVDRYSGWATIWSCKGTTLCQWLREHMKMFGMPRTISTDWGTEFMAADFQAMMRDNNINHRASSAYNPHSNNRAETGVKSMKRLLDEHAVKNDLQNENFIQAIITHRNTPVGRGLPSPNELVFGRKVPDYLPRPNKARMEKTPTEEKAEWRRKLELMEVRRDIQGEKDAERWSEHTRQLAALENGTCVAIQNGHGNDPTRWDKRGKVVRYNGFDSYDVMVENSRRITTRNRRHLRKINVEVDMTVRRPEELDQPTPENTADKRPTPPPTPTPPTTPPSPPMPPTPMGQPDEPPAKERECSSGGEQPPPRRSSRSTAGKAPARMDL